MNKSTSYDDETCLSGQGLLTIKILPEELEALQQEIKELKEAENYLDERYKGTCMYFIKDARPPCVAALLLEKVKCIDDSRLYLLQENEKLKEKIDLMECGSLEEAEAKGLK